MVNILGKKIDHEIIEITLYTAYLIIAIFAIPLYILYGQGAITEANYFTKTLSYISFFLAGFIILIGKKILSLKSLRDPEFYRKYGWLSGGVIHDPENGIIQNFKIGKFEPFRWAKSTTKMIVVSVIFFFGLVMYFGVFKNEFFSGVPAFEFQISNFGELIFGGFPGSPAETVFAIGIFYLIFVDPIKWVIHRLKLPKETFLVIAIGLAFLFAQGWVEFHNAKYGGQEQAQTVVYLFGFFNAILLLLFNSVIPFHIWHDFNNFFKQATITYSSEEVKSVIFLVFLFILLAGAIYLFILRKKQSIDQKYDFSKKFMVFLLIGALFLSGCSTPKPPSYYDNQTYNNQTVQWGNNIICKNGWMGESPKDRLDEDDVFYLFDKVIINSGNNYFYGVIGGSESMTPFFKQASIIGTKNKYDIQIGDIIIYKYNDPQRGTISIVHSVCNILRDDEGIYFVTKGYSNGSPDDRKIRLNQIEAVVMSIIYDKKNS